MWYALLCVPLLVGRLVVHSDASLLGVSCVRHALRDWV